MTETIQGVDRVAVPAGSVGGSRLVVPEGWVVDEAARDRLERQLDRAPTHVAGIVAESGELPPGASYRTHAEWQSLDASVPEEHGSNSARGAVLLRSGVEFRADADVVGVDASAGSLLVDPGAHVHDPWRNPGQLVEASEFGRSPFPRRPVVVFVAGECDAELADWLRRLVNRLVRRDIEARLALPDVTEGLHLTRPCLPGEATIRALAPDVIVTLDDWAAAEAAGWCGSDRSAVVIHFDDDVSVTTGPVSWQIGHASGRVRGVIGRRADAPSLAALVRRLCAGPQPMPPSGSRPTSETVALGGSARGLGAVHARRPGLRATVVTASTPGGYASRRIQGLSDQLAAVGVAVTDAPLDGELPLSSVESDLLILAGVDGPIARKLVQRRRDAGRTTVVDVSPDVLAIDADAVHRGPSLEPRLAELVMECGCAISPGGAVQTALQELGARAHVLPTMLTRARTAELREARSIGGFELAADPVLRWQVSSAGVAPPAYSDSIAVAISEVLADHAEMHAEVVAPEGVPAALRDREHVSVASGDVGPGGFLHWVVHVWTPPVLGGDVVDDLYSLVEASTAGVPSAMSAEARSAVDGHVPAELVVAAPERPEEWIMSLGTLVDDETRRVERSREAFRQSNTVHGPVASKAAVHRFLGWALRGGSS